MCFKAGIQAGKGICKSIPDKLGGYGQSKGSLHFLHDRGEKSRIFFFLLSLKAMILEGIRTTEILFSYLVPRN